MSLIESFSRVSAPKLPRVDGLIPWIVPLAIILIWQLACVTGFVSARVLPAPSDVALAGWKLLLSGELVHRCQSIGPLGSSSACSTPMPKPLIGVECALTAKPRSA